MIINHDACLPFQFVDPVVGTRVYLYLYWYVDKRNRTHYRVYTTVWPRKPKGCAIHPCDWWSYA